MWYIDIFETTLTRADLGTRPGPHGETLLSTGLADFDSLLGGGIPLGAVTLLLEDAWTPHGSTLLRYFVAEGAACGHTVHWAGASRPLAPSLPQLAKARASRSVRLSVQHWLIGLCTLLPLTDAESTSDHRIAKRTPQRRRVLSCV